MPSSGFTHERNLADHWITPKNLIEELGDFDLDPCGCEINQPWPTAGKIYFLPEENGLLLPWAGRVWLNPPYGRETERWIQRMAVHANGMLLIFARTETRMFQELWKYGSAFFFFSGRLKFCRPDGSEGESASAPSCLVAFGDEMRRRLARANLQGSCVTTWEHRNGAMKVERMSYADSARGLGPIPE